MEPPAKQYVVGFLFSPDKSTVVLIKKDTEHKPEQAWQHGLLNGVGGELEKGEMPLDAMRREFQQETGMHVAEWFGFCEIMWRGSHITFFRATGDVSRARTVTREEVRRMPVAHLDGHLTVRHLAWLIPMALSESGITAVVNDPS